MCPLIIKHQLSILFWLTPKDFIVQGDSIVFFP